MQLLSSLLVVVFFSTPSFARPLQAEQQSFLEIISNIQGNDARKKVVSIEALKDFHFSDVADVVIELANQELDGKKNKRVLEYYIMTLAEIADRSHVFPPQAIESGNSPILDFKERLSHKMSSEGERFASVKIRLKRLIDEAVAKIRSRNVQSPKLFPEYDKLDLEKLNTIVEAVKNPEIATTENLVEKVKQEESFRSYKKFEDELRRLTGSKFGQSPVKAGDSSPPEILLAGTTEFVTDEIYQRIKDNTLFEIVGREAVLEQVLMVLARYKQQNAVLNGSKGAGKTSIVQALAENIVRGTYDNNEVTAFLKDAVIIQTSSARISRLAKTDKPAGQADAMEAYFHAIKEVQKKIDRRVIVFIDEIHTLTPEQVEAIKPFIESSTSKIMLLGASTSREFRNSFKHNEAFLRRIQEVAVREFTEQEILEIFKTSWMKTLKARHNNVQISEEVMKLMIRKSRYIYPDKGTLDGTFVLADHLSGYLRFKSPGTKDLEITSDRVYDFLKEHLALPVDPRNAQEMEAYRSELVEKVSERVLGQERMVNDVINLWMDVLRNESKRGVRVGLVLGRSGTGKTETAEVLADVALKSDERVFTIKGNQFSDANDIKMSTIVGVPGGVNYGKTSSGRLIDWLTDPSKGLYSGIIVIDEVEKANLLFFEVLMEMFDKGYIEGGDGKHYNLNKHMILMTTNHGDKTIFPDEVISWSEEQIEQRLKEISLEDLRILFESFLPDSIVNRVDMVTVSSVIPHRVAKQIVAITLDKIAKDLLESSDLRLDIDPELIEDFIRGNDPLRRGVRPLIRSAESHIKNAIERIKGTSKGDYAMGDTVILKRFVQQDGVVAIEATINQHRVLAEMPRMGEGKSCKAIF